MTFQKSILKPISTNATKIPDTPQIQIDNPLDRDIFINGIELILGAEFSKKGKLLILINEVSVFDENDSKAFFGYAKFPIPLGKTLKRSHDIQIFAWNGTDSNTIDVKANLSLSEKNQPFNTQAETLGKDVFNELVSETVAIIPVANYDSQTITKLLDMQGYKKLILTMLADNFLYVIVSSDMTNPAKAIDNDLSSSTAQTNLVSPAGTLTTIVDFASLETRPLSVKWSEIGTNGETFNIEIFTSDDNIVYNSKLSQNHTNNASVNEFTDDIASHSFRFVKVVFTYLTGNDNSGIKIFEIYDRDTLGGTASFSFEIRDSVSGRWIGFISAATLGTVTSGNDIIKQIGDVINDVASDKFNIILPSTQTDFRVKLIISGKMNVGASIVKG